MSGRGKRFLVPGFLFLILFTLYGLTHAVGLTGLGDSDELIMAGITGALPHPPGFVLLHLLLRGITRLPFGSAVSHAHLLAALVMALAGRCLFYVVSAPTKTKQWLTLLVIVGWFATPLIWEHGTVLEVFGLNGLLALGLLLCTFRLDKPVRQPFTEVGWGVVAALGIFHHQTFFLVLAPAIIYLGKRVKSWRMWLTLTVVIALQVGWLWLLTQEHHLWSWRVGSGWQGIWDYYWRRDFSGFSPGTGMLSAWFKNITLESSLNSLQFYVEELGRHLNGWLVLAASGFIYGRRLVGRRYLLMTAVWLLAGPLFSLLVGLPTAAAGTVEDETGRMVAERMFVLSEMILGYFAVLGSWWWVAQLSRLTSRKWLIPIGLEALALSSTIQIGLNYPAMDLSGYRVMDAYIQELFDRIPTHGRLVCLSDLSCFGAAVAQAGYKDRPDIRLLSPAPQFQFELNQQYPLSRFYYPDNPARIGEAIGWSLIAKQPVTVVQLSDYWATTLGLDGEAFWLVPDGYGLRVVATKPTDLPQLAPSYTATRLLLTHPEWQRHRFVKTLAAQLAETHTLNAALLTRMNFPVEAKQEIGLGLSLQPANAQLISLENSLANFVADPRYQPNYQPPSLLSLAAEQEKLGRLDRALHYSQIAVWQQPQVAERRVRLAELYERINVPSLAKREYQYALLLDSNNSSASAAVHRLRGIPDLPEWLE